jgi:hypothetical protein
MEQFGRAFKNDTIDRQYSIVFRHRPFSPPISLNVNVDDEDGSFDLEFVGLPTSCYLARSILSQASSTTLWACRWYKCRTRRPTRLHRYYIIPCPGSSRSSITSLPFIKSLLENHCPVPILHRDDSSQSNGSSWPTGTLCSSILKL